MFTKFVETIVPDSTTKAFIYMLMKLHLDLL